MKVFIVLSAIVACCVAEGLEGYAAPAVVSKVVNVNTGYSTQSRKQDLAGNYAFSYDNSWSDGAWGSGAHSRRESGDAWGNKEGSYSLNIGDGRSRLVKYVADGAGFRASIKTNEPGIVSSNPAAVDINTPHGGYGGDLGGLGGYGKGLGAVVTQVGGYSDAGYGSGLALGGKGLDGGYGLGGGLALGGYGGGLNAGLGGLGGYGGGLGGGLGGGYGGAY